MAGVDLRTVQELMGHKTITMTLRHSHLSPAHQLDAVERLDRTATGTTKVRKRPPARAAAQVRNSQQEKSAPGEIRTPDLLVRSPITDNPDAEENQ